MVHVDIVSESIQVEKVQSLVEGHKNGGIVHFVGTVRNQTNGEPVKYLDFECYEPMAIKEMRKIGEAAINKFQVTAIALIHRVGKAELGETVVAIAASSPHRKNAFLACEFAIDTLKETVPIWKKEVFENGYHWVSAHP